MPSIPPRRSTVPGGRSCIWASPGPASRARVSTTPGRGSVPVIQLVRSCKPDRPAQAQPRLASGDGGGARPDGLAVLLDRRAGQRAERSSLLDPLPLRSVARGARRRVDPRRAVELTPQGAAAMSGNTRIAWLSPLRSAIGYRRLHALPAAAFRRRRQRPALRLRSLRERARRKPTIRRCRRWTSPSAPGSARSWDATTQRSSISETTSRTMPR